MRGKLEKYINKLCKKSMATQAGKEMHDELLQNTLDRYDEELVNGKTEREAYDIAIASLGDMEAVVKKNSRWSMKKVILLTAAIVCLIAIAITGCAVTSIDYYDDASKYTVGGGTISEEIHSFEINWLNGEVNISAYDGEVITLTETGAKSEDQKMRYLVDNGVLRIQFQASGINISWPSTKTLEVKIPSAMAKKLTDGEFELASADVVMLGLGISDLSIETASGNLTATDCSFSSIEADTASGDYKFENCDIASLEMSAASGNTKINGSVGSIEYDSASGDLTITSTQTPKRVSIDTASGNVKLNIPADSQFTCEYETASGDVEFNGFSGNYSDEKFVCGNGENKYELDSASGNLTINAQ